MKCPGCGLYHPPQYENCVSCGVKLKNQDSNNQEVAGPSVVTTERPATRDNEKAPRRGRGAKQDRAELEDELAFRDHEKAQPEEKSRTERSRDQPSRDDRSNNDRSNNDRSNNDRLDDEEQTSSENEFDMSERPPDSVRRSKYVKGGFKSGVPTSVGILVALTVLLVSAGATFFFVTKQPDDQRLMEQGQRELQNGQYAFAVTTLNQALALRKKDGKVYLSLARAYVGVDQVEKAWDCISQAQQLGMGVIAEPALASDLANFYRQRGKYERAIELLRPLAKGGIPGKKAELADLDALWGDEALRNGNVEQALKCWEEVRDLREGSRYGEADARLATIYQKCANAAANGDDDAKALVYLSKLNNIAQNSRNYEMASDIYVRTGELELAIDQLRKAIKMGARNPVLEKKLSLLLTKRGKELLDQGNTDAGLGYLQQAKDINGDSQVPEIALRNVETTFEGGSHLPKITGEVWNSSEKSINSLNLKVELYDSTTSRVIWFKDQKMVDEFVPPLGAKDAKPFEFLAGDPVKNNGSAEFRVYLDGTLYKSYPIGKKDRNSATAKSNDDDLRMTISSPLKPIPTPKPKPKPVLAQPDVPKVDTTTTNAPTPNPVPTVDSTPPVVKGTSSEEKTMKDLEP